MLGFQEIWQNPRLRALTASRSLNNLAYVSWAVALPFLAAAAAGDHVGVFANLQASATTLLSIGSILAGAFGSWYFHQRTSMGKMVLLASGLGILSVGLLMAGVFAEYWIAISGLTLGIGQYCFRLSGMILGQANTPRDRLSPVIIAGDTLVRFWSFLVTFAVVGCLMQGLHAYVLFLSLGALAAPALSYPLAALYRSAKSA